jgi:hypothetical protein
MRMTTIWLSPDTYRKLLLVEKEIIARKGCNTNPNGAIRELIEFLEKTQASDVRAHEGVTLWFCLAIFP